MKKLSFFYAAALSMTLGLGFVACGDDNDEPAIVLPPVPATEGWSTATDGTVIYTVDNDADTEDELDSYYSFKVNKNKVSEALYVGVAYNEQIAKQLGNLFQTGQWADMDEDEAGLAPARQTKRANISRGFTNNLRGVIRTLKATRAESYILPFSVNVSGRNIYITIPAFEGKSLESVKNVINYWEGNGEVEPSDFMFGTWDGTTYTCNNIAGVGVNYKVVTAYNSDNECTSYVTTVACPNSSWAAVYKKSLEEQASGFEEMFGKAPIITQNGNTITVEAAIVDMIEKEYIVMLLQEFDWLNNEPFLRQIL